MIQPFAFSRIAGVMIQRSLSFVKTVSLNSKISSVRFSTGIAAGESAMMKLFRDQANDTYAQPIGLAGIEIKYQAKIMLNSTY